MKLVTKYQISAINNCWEKCDEKCAYMFNVYKNQLSRQTGSRNLTDPKTLPTLWYTYMTLVTKYQISAINSYWEKCDEKYLGRTEGRTDRGKTVSPPSGSRGITWGRCNLKRSRRTVIFLPVYKISSLKITPPNTPNSGQFSYPLPNIVSFLFRIEFRFRSRDFSFTYPEIDGTFLINIHHIKIRFWSRDCRFKLDGSFIRFVKK